MKIQLLIIMTVTFIYASSDTLLNNVFHVNASMVLKTIDQQQSEKLLITAIDEMGGGFLLVTVGR